MTARRNFAALFRCDGGRGIGSGHVIRCLALAEALTNLGWRCGFAISAETAGLEALKESGFEIRVLAEPESADGLKPRGGAIADLLVIDHYGLGVQYERAARSSARAILVLDDGAWRPHCADLLLDAGHGRCETDYSGLAGCDCELLLGLDYMPLRAGFGAMRARALSREVRRRAARLFVSFGGVDGKGMCLQALQSLEGVTGLADVDIVIGAEAPRLSAVLEAAAASAHRVRVHVDCGHVAALLSEADLALGAAGVSALERCALGVPSILVCVAENQEANYDALVEAGAGVGIGRARKGLAEAMRTALISLIDDGERRAKMARRAAAMCDAKGALRAAEAIDRYLREEVRDVEDRPYRCLSS